MLQHSTEKQLWNKETRLETKAKKESIHESTNAQILTDIRTVIMQRDNISLTLTTRSPLGRSFPVTSNHKIQPIKKHNL